MNRRLVLLPVLVALAGAALWLVPRTGPIVVPAVEWRLKVGDGERPARNFDEVPAETRVRLWFRCDEPRHVYVLSHSATDGTLLLFPSPAVRSDLVQPLRAGQQVLPGRDGETELAWTTRTQVLPATTFVVVAGREPVAELEALLPRLRRWTNSALQDRSMQVMAPPEGTAELVGGPNKPWPAPLLQRAADTTAAATLVNGPLEPDPVLAGVWFGAVRVKELAKR
jgi:hypothetical protein